jgi:hypothetical protein
MKASRSIHLSIGNALPHGNAAESAAILALWQDVQGYFNECAFSAACPGRAEAGNYLIRLDATAQLRLMQRAQQEAGSFDGWRQAHVHDESKSLAASLLLEVGAAADFLNEQEAYEIATLFLQQLVLAINLTLPGACRVLQTAFTGEIGHRYEAQSFDSKLYYGAFRNLRDLGWWQRHSLGFDQIWQWLEKVDGSHGNTAIKHLDKVLFTLIKLAEQRSAASSRTALLVLYQLETLLDCRSPMDARHLRKRIHLVLGALPETGNCINELYAVRDGLLFGNRPVLRSPLISHYDITEFMEQEDQCYNAVELGTALTLVLLRELIQRDAQAFLFSERVEFGPTHAD